jgi:hypothetical protein
MADDVINPMDQHGVPLYGPLADRVNAALQATSAAELAHRQNTGGIDPERFKAAMRRARENAIAEHQAEQGNGNG